MKTKIFLSIFSLLTNIFSFAQIKPHTGLWEGKLQLNEITFLPFKFNIKENKGKFFLEIINGDERILVDEVILKNDSLQFKMPVFDSEFRCKIINPSQIQGVWINHARIDKNVIRFDATRNTGGEYVTYIDYSISGHWESTFSNHSKDSSKAIFILRGSTIFLEGTFLTETGDYRFLSGETNNGKNFYLSCFDGSHAFLFRGEIKGDSIINGQFFSGMHWYETWVAVRNDKFELRNPDSLTYLKPGYDKIDFSFKNLEGKTVSLSDEKFKNKVVIIQIMGSWCPNCMDETAFLAPLYEKNKSKGLEIVALAFEKSTDFAKAASNVTRLKNKFNANYEFLITEKTGKDMASGALPMLNGISAFPTTIFIDKKGKVRKIYTGFYGPGTGKYYDKFVDETNLFLEKLLQE